MLQENVELNERNQIEYEKDLTSIFFLEKKKNIIQILQSINAEESPLDSTIDSESSEYEDKKIQIVDKSISTTETDEVIEV